MELLGAGTFGWMQGSPNATAVVQIVLKQRRIHLKVLKHVGMREGNHRRSLLCEKVPPLKELVVDRFEGSPYLGSLGR